MLARKLTPSLPLLQRSPTGPTYRLYGVVLHSGGGPHSGHYTSYVKSSDGRWNHMNDSDVSSMRSEAPVNNKSAYILFYCREKGDALSAAINGVAAADLHPNGSPQTKASANANGKRQRDSYDGNGSGFRLANEGYAQPPPPKKAFIGPTQPGGPRPVSPKFVAPFQSNGAASMMSGGHKQNRSPKPIPMKGALVHGMKGKRPAVLT